MESLFASEGELVYVYDRDLKLVFVNAAGARLLGAQQAELVGKAFVEIAPDERVLMRQMQEVAATKRPVQQMRAYSGRMFEQAITPILDERGDVQFLVSSNRDITQRPVSEQRAQQLQILTERLAATLNREAIANIVIAQLDGFLNAAASVAYFSAGDGVMSLREQILGTLTSSRSPHRPPFTVDDQRLLQDIADRAGIAIANAQLFEAERTARQLRDDFLSIAGHELRTPLTAMQLQVDSLIIHAKRGTFANRPELLDERLDKTARAVTRLDRLIRQLLDVSHLVRGRLAYTREQVDLHELIAEVIDRASEHAARPPTARPA